MRKIISLSFIYLCLLPITNYAQPFNTSSTPTTVEEINVANDSGYIETTTTYDENTIYIGADAFAESTPITIDQQQWNKLTDDKAFNYERVQQVQENNFLVQIFIYLIQFFGSPIGQVILWILVVGIVLLIVFFILKRLKLTNRADKSIALGTEVTASFATATDWNTAINNALQQQNYPLAVAYMFRHLVFQLHEKEILKITDTATNSRLLRDLRPQSYYKDFRAITTQYEYVCFGDYPINNKELEHYQQQYRKILAQI